MMGSDYNSSLGLAPGSVGLALLSESHRGHRTHGDHEERKGMKNSRKNSKRGLSTKHKKDRYKDVLKERDY